MSTEIVEKEIKILFEKVDYEKLLQHFIKIGGVENIEIYTNHYFETENSWLSKHGLMLRIREDGYKYEMTLKQDLLGKDNAVLRREYNIPLAADLGRDMVIYGIGDKCSELLGKISDYSKYDIKKELMPIGNIRTERTHLKIVPETYGLVLDRNNYLDMEDYELEWEVEDILGANKMLKDLFKEVGVSGIVSSSSKKDRFRKRKKLYDTNQA